MMPAAKHGDPQMGVDIHLCVVPPSPSPVPLPTPHMSVVFDPFDYVPILGATVTVCGMKRAVAGTSGKAVHIPPGFPFAPKMPDTNDEIFMGSATVVADGDPFSFLSVPVLACQVAGMPSPPRPKQHEKKLMLLPTVVNMAIPTNVFIGGPPTISMMGMAFKLGFAALGRLAKSRFGRALGQRFRDWRKAKWGHLNPSFLKCAILRAEPVNIVNGAVTVEQEDFKIAGAIPVRWARRYTSDNVRRGACGVGWECPADARLGHDAESGVVTFHHPEGGIAVFPGLPEVEGNAAAVLELMDGARLSDHGSELRVRTKEDRIYRFPKSLARDQGRGEREFPLERVDDLCGNSLRYERAGGRLLALHEAGGRRIELRCNPEGFIQSILLEGPERDSPHTFAEYEYDAPDLVEARDALGSPYRYAYDQHRMLQHTDRNGLTFYYEYEKSDDAWRVVRSWGDGGLYAYEFVYLDAACERRIRDSLGNVWLVKIDERGLPISEIDPLGGLTSYAYDESARTVAVEDQDGHRTEYEFDVSGNLQKLTRADGGTITTEFDVDGRAVAITDSNGGRWQQTWDSRGLMVEHATPLGNATRYEYDSLGQLTAFTSPRGARTEVAFDVLGNLTSLTDARGHKSEFRCDHLGNVIRKRDPLGNETLYRYDNCGRLVRARLPSGASISCAYDGEGNLTGYRDANGAETSIEYVGLAEVAARILPDGQVVRYAYDTEERLVAVTNQRGETYRFQRDGAGRIVAETDYWGQTRRYRYTACGYLAEASDPLGRVIRYETDPLGRISRTAPSSAAPGEPDQTETFEYDGDGNIIACSNASISIAREFDLEGNLLAERIGPDCTVASRYDACGNRIARTSTRLIAGRSHALTVRYAYDAIDQVIRAEIEGHAPIEISRNALGQPVEERLGALVRRRCDFGADGNPTAQQVLAAELPLFAQEYRYDAAGNLVGRRDSAHGIDQYGYDTMGRLTAHLSPEGRPRTYLTDPAGDRLNARALETTGQEGQWRREGEYDGTHYRFDRAGNLVRRVGVEGDTQFIWDAYQRLAGTRTKTATTTYCYDPFGRRIRKQTGDTTIHFCWDGDLLLGDAIVSGELGTEAPLRLVREWVPYPDTYEQLAQVHLSTGKSADNAHNSILYYYHNDPNGCPTRLLDGAGNAVWAALYAGWGSIERLPSDDIDNPIRLQGQYEDWETGLYYNYFRYYDAATGQFISPDPIGLLGGLQLYNSLPNILSWIDPLGLKCHLPKDLKRQFRKIEELAQTAGNKGVRAALSPRELRKIGEEFVGEGYKIAKGRHGELWLISADGKRLFRTPTPKRSAWARTGKQANFHQRNNIRHDWFDEGAVANVHAHSH